MGKSLLRFKSLLVLCIASVGIVLGYQNCGGGGLYVSLNSSGTADLFSQNFVEPFEPVSMFLHTGDKLFLMAAPDSTDVGSGNSSTASAQTKSLSLAQTSSQQSTAYHWFLGDSEVSVPGHFIVLQNIDESAPGDQNPRLPSPKIIPPTDQRFGSIWHSRLWDVHLWINSDTLTSGTPIVSRCNRIPGLPPLPDFFATTSATTCNNQALLRPQFGGTFPFGGFFVRTLPP